MTNCCWIYKNIVDMSIKFIALGKECHFLVYGIVWAKKV